MKFITLKVLLIVSISIIFFSGYQLNNQILKKEYTEQISILNDSLSNLENTLTKKDSFSDSILSIIESDGYLIYLIEEESKVDIPENVNPDHIKLMYEQAISNNIPIDIMFRLVYKESSFDSTAVSPVGAFGYMQLMPATYKAFCKRLKIEEYPHTVEKNIIIGTHMLSRLYSHWYSALQKYKYEIIYVEKESFDSLTWDHTLASYNAGITKVKYKGRIFENKGVANYIAYINKD